MKESNAHAPESVPRDEELGTVTNGVKLSVLYAVPRKRGTGTEFAPQTPQIGCQSPFSLVVSISKAP